jgi:hypothetical protein
LANNEVPLNNNTETTMTPRIIFDRWDNIVDINIALVELNADRNLFEVNRIRELEGTFFFI